jgi:GDP-L-fucose synthase
VIDKDKKILITGSSGFVGKHLITRLMKSGYNNLILPSHKDFELINPNAVATLFNKETPEVVVHLAARCGGIGANMNAPGEFWHDNLMMGINILNCSVQHKSKLIMLGTVCMYPKFTPIPFKEEDIFNGHPEETNAPYGLAKKCLLTGAQAYHKQYGLQYSYLVPTNMYGQFDNINLNTSHVIPAMLRKFIEAKKNKDPIVTLWGDGTPTRDFLYAGDCAEAIEKCIEIKAINDYVNLGTGKDITMSRLAEIISEIADYSGEIVWDITKPNGQPKRLLDTTKAKKVLEWESRIDLFDGLVNTYRWFVGEK